jgi:hypothetical protein
VPFVSHHYGGFIGYSLLPMHERFDLAECDYFLCGGDGAAATLACPSPLARWRDGVKRAAPVPVGSPWMDTLVESARGQCPEAGPGTRPRVMIILSALVGDNRYLGYVYPPEIGYWRFTRRLVGTLAAERDLTVVVKPPLRNRYAQLRSPLFDWLAGQDLPNVEVMEDVALKDCLNAADAFIVDSPSTPLLHVVATNKPVLAYIDGTVYRLVPLARELLARRAALLAETESEFFDGLQRFLQRPQWSRGPVDDAFLRQFCTYGGDGRSAERCANFLREVSEGHALGDSGLRVPTSPEARGTRSSALADTSEPGGGDRCQA